MEVLYTLMAYSPSLPSAWYTFASLPVLTHPLMLLSVPALSSLKSSRRVRGSSTCSVVARSSRVSPVFLARFALRSAPSAALLAACDFVIGASRTAEPNRSPISATSIASAASSYASSSPPSSS